MWRATESCCAELRLSRLIRRPAKHFVPQSFAPQKKHKRREKNLAGSSCLLCFFVGQRGHTFRICLISDSMWLR